MFPSFRKLSKSSEDSDEATDDEADAIIEKIEEIHPNGESFVKDIETYEIPQIHPVHENIRRLCRVCSNAGLININSRITNKMMTIKITRTNSKSWEKPISMIISEVSGENVSLRVKLHRKRKKNVMKFYFDSGD